MIILYGGNEEMNSAETIKKYENYIKGIKNKDDKIIADFYNEFSQAIYYEAHEIVKDEDAATDILQDTFIKAIKNINTLKDAHSLKA